MNEEQRKQIEEAATSCVDCKMANFCLLRHHSDEDRQEYCIQAIMQEENDALESEICELEFRKKRIEDEIYYIVKDKGKVANELDEMIARCNELFKERDELIEALRELIHLHACEQEGISAGMPTPQQWIEAVDKADNVLKQYDGTKIIDKVID